jgi:hypothetical protein
MTTSIIAQLLAPLDPSYDLHTESMTPWWIPVKFQGQNIADDNGDGYTDGLGYGDGSGSGASPLRMFGDGASPLRMFGDGDHGWGTGDGGSGSRFMDIQKRVASAARQALARS